MRSEIFQQILAKTPKETESKIRKYGNMIEKIKFQEYITPNNTFHLLVMFGDCQIGIIRQNGDGKFYADFKNSKFYWIDCVLETDFGCLFYDLDELKASILVTIADVWNSFQV